MTTSARPGPDDPTYGFKTSVLGATWAFRLTPNAIVWDKGRHSGSAAYLSVTRVRMTFRPVSMQSYRFTAEIWSEQGPKLTIASTSWKSMMEQERLDARYSTFVAELHRRIAAAHGPAIFEAGIPPVIYWVGIVVYAAVALGCAALIVRALQAGAWGE